MGAFLDKDVYAHDDKEEERLNEFWDKGSVFTYQRFKVYLYKGIPYLKRKGIYYKYKDVFVRNHTTIEFEFVETDKKCEGYLYNTRALVENVQNGKLLRYKYIKGIDDFFNYPVVIQK